MIKAILAGFIRHGLTALGTVLVTKGLADASTAQDLLGGGMAVFGILWSIYHKWTAQNAAQAVTVAQSTIQVASAFFIVCFIALGVTGCTSIVNTPQGKILSESERGIGFRVKYNSKSQEPDVTFGFWSSAFVLIPTSTNSDAIAAPNFANKFGFKQSGALSMGINEDITSGNYATYDSGMTNSAVLAQPITPK